MNEILCGAKVSKKLGKMLVFQSFCFA